MFAKEYNGGGHKNASGSPIPSTLLEEITKKLFKQVEKIEEEKK